MEIGMPPMSSMNTTQPVQNMNIAPPASVSESVTTLTNSPMSSSSVTIMSKASEKVLDKRRVADLVKEVDPMEQLDDDVEELLMEVADDFIDNVAAAACLLAKHRKSTSLDVKDVQLHLERNWNMWIPGFGSDEIRPYKKAPTTEAHKQRMALIKKNMKKY